MVAIKRAQLNGPDDYVVNLKKHHNQCELNFHLCMALFPQCRVSVDDLERDAIQHKEMHSQYSQVLAKTKTFVKTPPVKKQRQEGEIQSQEVLLYWQFDVVAMMAPHQVLNVLVERLDLAPYTTTLKITQSSTAKSYISAPSLTVRLYHDAKMAEVVAWNHHRYWDPVYSYPNRQMYHRDEKFALNRFLSEWLVYCRKLGLSPADFVNPLP